MTTRPVWTDPAAEVHWPPEHARKGFFTDTSICIGCKACEVACKAVSYTHLTLPTKA